MWPSLAIRSRSTCTWPTARTQRCTSSCATRWSSSRALAKAAVSPASSTACTASPPIRKGTSTPPRRIAASVYRSSRTRDSRLSRRRIRASSGRNRNRRAKVGVIVTGQAHSVIRFIRDIFANAGSVRRPVISFEFFPTKTDEGERALLEKTIPALRTLNPDFCSVTYGAGGGTRDKTLGIVERIQREHEITAMAHLTCVNATIDETRIVLDQTRALGITNVLALRGDPPNGGEFVRTEGGFEYSYQLVQCIREVGEFSIGVAGFPEGHIACKEGKHLDWQRLKQKIDRGADFVITQLFFDNRHYFECREFLAAQGVSA